jgi:hypothetical protein
MRKLIVLVAVFISVWQCFSQNCDCESAFVWAKKTFEENDAGFRLILEKKGKDAYNTHNQLITEKIKAAKDSYECMQVINDWLHFFRKGHIGFSMVSNGILEAGQEWETFPVDVATLKKYLENKQFSDYEGIFSDGTYKVGVKKAGDEYIGFIIESKHANWKPNEVKFKIIPDGNRIKSVYYMQNKSKVERNNAVEFWKNSILKIGEAAFQRIVPEVLGYEFYYKSRYATEPFLEKLDVNTLYFRLPSFDRRQKSLIDSVL